jgi:hypothetical protein
LQGDGSKTDSNAELDQPEDQTATFSITEGTEKKTPWEQRTEDGTPVT